MPRGNMQTASKPGLLRAFMGTWRTALKRILAVVVGAVLVLFVYLTRLERADPGPYYVAYPGNYRFIIDDTPTCKSTSPFLVVMVPVAPGDVAARDLIRQTWGGERTVHGLRVDPLFVMGLPGGTDAERTQEDLRQESRRHGDLIQSSFVDSYRNLTIKTMVTMEWLARRCHRAAFVAKVDSDVFLNVRNLVDLLLRPEAPRRDYVTGLVWWHSPVLRNPFNKFYMPRRVVPGSEYPPYPLGMAYVMSPDLPEKILQAARDIRPIFIEDAYLGMCLRRLGVAPTDPPSRHMFLVAPQHPLSACSLARAVAVTTTSPDQLRSYWRRSREEVHC